MNGRNTMVGRFMEAVGWTFMLIAVSLVLLAIFGGHAPEASWEGSGLSERWILAVAIPLLLVAGMLLVHRGRRLGAMRADAFLPAEGEQRIVTAIRAFERRTSGEIRVHLTRSGGDDPLSAAERVFTRLGMTKTADRNGVLFFVDIEQRRFAVVGDEGVHRHVGAEFWASVVERVEGRFRDGAFATGLEEGIRMAGEALATHFPYRADDVNELPDDISRD